MTKGLVTVFGASGFLGHFVVRELVKSGWRIRAAVRRPHTAQDLRVIGAVGQIQLVQANLRFRPSVEAALDGADAVINLSGILYNEGQQTFGAVHRMGAQMIGELAAARGITNAVHVSALGAGQNLDEKSSVYLQTKTAGEDALRAALPSADIMRPSIQFGDGDSFFIRFARMIQLSPALPLIGGGGTRFAPVYVGDVAEAIAQRINTGTAGQTYELAGPSTYTFKELMQFILTHTGRKRFLVPVPWLAANVLGMAGEISGALPLVKPFLTRDQVKSLRMDNVPSGDFPGLEDLGIRPETIEAIVPPLLEPYRKYGQFYKAPA